MLAVFYHDTVVDHHPFADWGWGGCSDLFPDVSVLFLFNTLVKDGWTALVLLSIFYFIGWFAASCGLGVALKRGNRLGLFSLLLLFWVAQICNYALPFDNGLHLLNPLFASMYHSGTGLLCLTCVALLCAQITGRERIAISAWLFVLAFLGGASDILFLIDFTVPALLSLGVQAVAFRAERNKCLRLGPNVALAGVASYFLAPYCFPVRLTTAQFIHLSFTDVYYGLVMVRSEISQPQHHLFAFMIVLDILTILGGLGGFLYFCFSSGRKAIPPVALGLMVFCSASIFLDWFTTLGTGLYLGMYANRYLAVALLIPMFIITFALHGIIQWRPWLEKVFAATIGVFAIGVSIIPQDLYRDSIVLEADIPFLKATMKERQIEVGLADYWLANLCTFLSDWQVPLRPATGDGRYNHDFSSLEWMGKGLPFEQKPRIRLLYAPDPLFGLTFGPPDEILYTPRHTPVWIYSEARAIVYSDIFNRLSNQLLDNGRTLPLNPSTFPSDTGTIEGTSRLAKQGRDRPGFLNGGPLLSLKPGQYRLSFHYEYLTPPAPDQIPTYDLLVHAQGEPDRELDSAPLPCSGTGPEVFSHDYLVEKPRHPFEMRIFYRGSGTIRLDSLNITVLSPAGGLPSNAPP